MTPRKEKALAALLTYPTKEKAAEAAGITSKTLRRYLQDPEFQERYKNAFSGLVGDAANTAKQSLFPALECLRRIMQDGACNAQVRVYAARTLLEYGLRLTEITDILATLEEAES